MTTEQELIDTLAGVRIGWQATPQSIMSPGGGVITSQEDLERLQQRDSDLVGYGYFYIDVRNFEADLALMHSTRPGYWETMLVPQRYSPLLPEDLARAVEDAGGSMGWSGMYPLNDVCLWKVRESYLGSGRVTD